MKKLKRVVNSFVFIHYPKNLSFRKSYTIGNTYQIEQFLIVERMPNESCIKFPNDTIVNKVLKNDKKGITCSFISEKILMECFEKPYSSFASIPR